MAGRPATARKASDSMAFRSVERNVERRRLTAEDEVRRLIDACFELVQKTGQLEPRVGEIVAAAGLSNQTFYRYFRSKDELLLAVLDEGVVPGKGLQYMAARANHQASAKITRVRLSTLRCVSSTIIPAQ